MGQGTLRGIVEAAYRLATPRSRWLEGLAWSAEDALGEGTGTVALVVDATDVRCPRVVDYASTRSIRGIDRVVASAFAGFEPEFVKESRERTAAASMATEGDVMEQVGTRLWLDAFGARDMLTLMAMDPTGVGVLTAINLAEPARKGARRSTSLAQLSAHILGAYHLREQSPAEDDAVFHADGDVVRASDAVREAGVLGDLTNAVRALGALRGTRSDDVRALDRFTSRVDATWSVVAEVDDGADRWVVAKRNPSTVLPLPGSLSQRETQVMSLLLLGRTQKVVAYELGIAHSTVRVLVSRALTKVGAKNVEEVRARFVSPS